MPYVHRAIQVPVTSLPTRATLSISSVDSIVSDDEHIYPESAHVTLFLMTVLVQLTPMNKT